LFTFCQILVCLQEPASCETDADYILLTYIIHVKRYTKPLVIML